ncbi:hypothetical protein [Paenibacillus albus]|nr:hypothetical protein [Paenibacillus albus]
MMTNEHVFYGGLIVAGVALMAGLFATVVLIFSWKMLSAKLDAEYGKKRK